MFNALPVWFLESNSLLFNIVWILSRKKHFVSYSFQTLKKMFLLSKTKFLCISCIVTNNIQGLGLWCLMLLFNNICFFWWMKPKYIYTEKPSTSCTSSKSHPWWIMFCFLWWCIYTLFLASICLLVVSLSEWTLFNTKSTIFQLHYGENKLFSSRWSWWWGPLCTRLTCLVGLL